MEQARRKINPAPPPRRANFAPRFKRGLADWCKIQISEDVST
jgi:hypothetical protein